MKLRSLHIEDYKMFKDFDISFVDENDEALPIIVLAGVNGSGKTTLLECLFNPKFNNENMLIEGVFDDGYIENYSERNVELMVEALFELDNTPLYKHGVAFKRRMKESLDHQLDNYRLSLVYLPAGANEIKNIKETIRQKYIDRAFEIDKPSEALRELQKYISKIFDGLNLTFNLSSIDYNKKEVLFKDSNGVEFDIDDLSTGEKTLLSKVLYLYFEDYKEKIILIDEPELSLHPSWQNKVLKIYENFAKQNNCQIIIATHSPHIIGSAKSKYIKLLVKEDNKIKVVDNFSNTYGLKFGQILTEVMGVEHLRPVEVDEQLDKVKAMIVQNDFESDTFREEWKKLEDILGADYMELKLLKIEMASRKKNVSSK